MAGTTLILDAKETRLIDAYRKGEAAQAQLTAKTLAGARQQNAAINGTARAVRGVGDEVQKAGGKFKAAFGTQAIDMAKKLAGAFGLGTGVAGAVGAATTAYKLYQDTIRETSDIMRKASTDIIGFAALQEPGGARDAVERLNELQKKYGTTPAERAQVADAVQALQSSIGIQEGFKAAEVILNARGVGIPVDVGKELEMRGSAFGLAPGETTRKAFVAGELGPSNPQIVATAGPALPFFQDPNVALATAGGISGAFGQETGTFTKNVGVGLSELKPMFAQLSRYFGPIEGEHTQLRALKFLGIDSAEEFKSIGVGELRQQAGLSAAVQNLDTIEKILKAFESGAAAPGVIAAEAARLEKELPEIAIAKKIEAEETAQENAIAFGPRAIERTTIDLENARRATAATELGLESAGIVKVVENKRTTRLDVAQLAAQEMFLRPLTFASMALEFPAVGLKAAVEDRGKGLTFAQRFAGHMEERHLGERLFPLAHSILEELHKLNLKADADDRRKQEEAAKFGQDAAKAVGDKVGEVLQHYLFMNMPTSRPPHVVVNRNAGL